MAAQTTLASAGGLKTALERLQESPSLVAAYPIQDLLALDPDCVTEDTDAERVNVPGTVQESNWTWRMNISLEDLINAGRLNREISGLCSIRENRKADFTGGSK